MGSMQSIVACSGMSGVQLGDSAERRWPLGGHHPFDDAQERRKPELLNAAAARGSRTVRE